MHQGEEHFWERHTYVVIGCAVFARECFQCAAGSRNVVDVRILEQGLHDIGEAKMSSALQREIDAIDPASYDAILLAYGLCNNGVRGLRARVPLVVPRAHDCITLLMGSKEEYQRHFQENPGTYYLSVGWIERAKSNLSNPQSTTRAMGMGSYEEYVEKYGEENACYLMETLNNHLRNYSRVAYIDTGIPGTDYHKQTAEEWADEQGWEYSIVRGSTQLIAKMMDGQWDEDEFLVVPPGKTLEPSHDDGVVRLQREP